MNAPADTRYMQLALSLGRRGLGNTAPNPAVGCVVVKNKRILGRGWTQPGGRPHAEIVALSQAGSAAHGADVYVSLEPCAHHGETPPCADALITAGVARVVVAVQDSDPRVDGLGMEMLRKAGIAVDTGVCAKAAQGNNAGFFLRTEHQRPYVTLKLAGSFDGRIATGTGDSKWITGVSARRLVHAMRARHDAVMIGGGTARQDDPTLTARDLGDVLQPARVVVARQLDLPLTGNLAQTAKDVPVILCHGPEVDPSLQEAWNTLGAQLLPCAIKGSQLDVQDVLQQLATHGLTRVFCEGGSALAASLIEADMVDELIGFTAGLTMGAEGLPGIGALKIGKLADALRFELLSVRSVGADICHTWRRSAPDV